MKTSVASVTFRSKSIAQVATLAYKSGLDAIEWGGDIHLPPGNEKAITETLKHTKQNGLETSAYGSYYRACKDENFAPVLHTAIAINARVIRVWAGEKASALYTPAQRVEILLNLKAAVHHAAKAGCVVATEYHSHTLTDTLESTLAMLDEVPGLKTLWQPPIGLSVKDNLHALTQLQGHIENLHVYHRSKDGISRPLREGSADWQLYLAAAQQTIPPRYATLEFVSNDSEEQFSQDASTLHSILQR